jgi:L-arabinose isomerase
MESFEVSQGNVFGDLLSEPVAVKPLVVGVIGTGFFEYWRMYPNLRAKVEADMQVIVTRLREAWQIVYPGLLDTMDSADAIGRALRETQVDVVIIAERTYTPDMYIHQALSHLPNTPIVYFISQPEPGIDIEEDYEATLRASGLMATVQLECGFQKMQARGDSPVVVGGIHEDLSYTEMARELRLLGIRKHLANMTIGVVGNVFRGMFDFEYDKTAVKGKLGPEILSIQVDRLLELWEATRADEPEVTALVQKVNKNYEVIGVPEQDIIASARVAVALQRLIQRFRLGGLVLLGQHFVEAKMRATSYLGLAELHEAGTTLATTEGDALGLIMMVILRELTGRTPFFGEWGEFDVPRNAMMVIGHGYADPRQHKQGLKPRVKPSPEQWGLAGAGFNFEITFDPGPVTVSHFVHAASGWRMLVTGGEILALPPIPCGESSFLFRVERPIRNYVADLVKAGFPHHCIAARGDVRADLLQFAKLMGIEAVSL